MEDKPWPNLEAEGLLPSKFRPRQIDPAYFFVRLNDNIHLIPCSSVTMPDELPDEFNKKRLIKKKDNDMDMEEDSDEEMLQLLKRQVRRHFPLLFVRECRAACIENDVIPEGRIRFRRINSFEDCLQSGR